MVSHEDVDQFFRRYGSALAAGELEAVADAYGYPSLVLGGPEPILVSRREDVLAAFAGAAERQHADGFTRATPHVHIIDGEAAAVAWVSVQWVYSSEDGTKEQLDAYRYLLRPTDQGYVIAALAPAPTSAV